jgi:hypothetical protein
VEPWWEGQWADWDWLLQWKCGEKNNNSQTVRTSQKSNTKYVKKGRLINITLCPVVGSHVSVARAAIITFIRQPNMWTRCRMTEVGKKGRISDVTGR